MLVQLLVILTGADVELVLGLWPQWGWEDCLHSLNPKGCLDSPLRAPREPQAFQEFPTPAPSGSFPVSTMRVGKPMNLGLLRPEFQLRCHMLPKNIRPLKDPEGWALQICICIYVHTSCDYYYYCCYYYYYYYDYYDYDYYDYDNDYDYYYYYYYCYCNTNQC